MIYGIEQSTDMQARSTVIKRFASVTAAKNWAKQSGGFTHADPEAAQNHHRTFRKVYQTPAGWRPPTKKQIADQCWRQRGSIYSPSAETVLANAIHAAGTPLDA